MATAPTVSHRPGFTLIELMIAASIISILAMIAIPKFAGLIEKSKEASIKGSLGSVRSALTLYYASNEGIWPSDTLSSLEGTLTPAYIDVIPHIRTPRDTTPGGNEFITSCAPGEFHCSIGWVYCRDLPGESLGPGISYIRLSCKKRMLSGQVWTEY